MSNQKFMSLNLTSPVFENNSTLPATYTCDGVNVNPPFFITGTPEKTQSLILIVDDLDAVSGDWVHWLVWNIPPTCTEILENSVPLGANLALNDFKEYHYGGPCPPNGKHNYQFKLYALDKLMEFENPETITKSDIELHMEGHIIEMAILNAYYARA
jgi:Raf kinase inhibitor-like YbhB/YbcL family protein